MLSTIHIYLEVSSAGLLSAFLGWQLQSIFLSDGGVEKFIQKMWKKDFFKGQEQDKIMKREVEYRCIYLLVFYLGFHLHTASHQGRPVWSWIMGNIQQALDDVSWHLSGQFFHVVQCYLNVFREIPGVSRGRGLKKWSCEYILISEFLKDGLFDLSCCSGQLF